jgi:Ca2+-binding EF-hand superfamily protein
MTDKDEIPFELKNDIKIAFDLFKNENNKITKLKLRTLLFSFIMFKSSASEINRYIEDTLSPKQELFDLDDLNLLIRLKLKEAKLKEANELIYAINGNESSEIIKESDFLKTLQKHKIDMNEKDVKEMFQYINGEEEFNKSSKKESTVSTEKLRNFYFNFN